QSANAFQNVHPGVGNGDAEAQCSRSRQFPPHQGGSDSIRWQTADALGVQADGLEQLSLVRNVQTEENVLGLKVGAQYSHCAVAGASGAGEATASSARFSSSTFTRGWPSRPSCLPSVCRATKPSTVSRAMPRACATRSIWMAAACGLMCGSMPLPDCVTRSLGMAEGSTP